MVTIHRPELKTIYDVRDFLYKEIEDKNDGGCGILALAMYRWLKKNEPMLPKAFIFAYNERGLFSWNSRGLDHPSSTYEPQAPQHVGLVVNTLDGMGTVIMDAVEGIDVLKYSYTHTFDDEAFVVKAVNNTETWNHEFDRSQINTIATALGIDLSDIVI